MLRFAGLPVAVSSLGTLQPPLFPDVVPPPPRPPRPCVRQHPTYLLACDSSLFLLLLRSLSVKVWALARVPVAGYGGRWFWF